MPYSLGPIRRCILLGGGPVLLAVAAHCRKKKLDVLVITSPRHAGESLEGGRTFQATCKAEKMKFLVTESITAPAVQTAIGSMEKTIAISLGAAWLFTDAVIKNLFDEKLINTHGKRLPQDRGGGGFSWEILRGDRLGICLLHRVDAGIDTGDILAYEEFVFPASCHLPQDYARYHGERDSAFLCGILDTLKKGERLFPLLAQPEYLSSYNPRLHTPTHGWIDWSWEAADLERFICAFDLPYPGAMTRWNTRVVHLRNVFLQKSEGGRHPSEAGIVYRKGRQWLLVAAKDGDLIVSDVEDDGDKSLFGDIQVGDRFVTTADDITASKQRVFYDASGVRKKSNG